MIEKLDNNSSLKEVIDKVNELVDSANGVKPEREPIEFRKLANKPPKKKR